MFGFLSMLIYGTAKVGDSISKSNKSINNKLEAEAKNKDTYYDGNGRLRLTKTGEHIRMGDSKDGLSYGYINDKGVMVKYVGRTIDGIRKDNKERDLKRNKEWTEKSKKEAIEKGLRYYTYYGMKEYYGYYYSDYSELRNIYTDRKVYNHINSEFYTDMCFEIDYDRSIAFDWHTNELTEQLERIPDLERREYDNAILNNKAALSNYQFIIDSGYFNEEQYNKYGKEYFSEPYTMEKARKEGIIVDLIDISNNKYYDKWRTKYTQEVKR